MENVETVAVPVEVQYEYFLRKRRKTKYRLGSTMVYRKPVSVEGRISEYEYWQKSQLNWLRSKEYNRRYGYTVGRRIKLKPVSYDDVVLEML